MIGPTLSHFRITAKLGEGGMGEVYRATDTKLNREVAIKTLPDGFYLDEQRMGRFTREAQVLASLSHPNIGAIFGVEEEDGKKVLILELIEGETLAERIGRGALPLEEALGYAQNIAEALEAAHEKGVVHRDLKPANIKITPEGVVKVLDFGLAKALDDAPGPNPDLSNSPTLTAAATQMGMILGTAGYMAPEQARGKPVDRRADVWAFGIMLFEMLTARRAFGGETVSDTLAKILEREPDWEALPPSTPAPVRRLLRRCLTKDPGERLQAIGDARIAISEYLADPEAFEVEVVAATPAWRRWLPWALIPVAALATWAFLPEPRPTATPVVRSVIPLPDGGHLSHRARRGVAISPDGQRLALVSRSDVDDPQTGLIYTRRLDQFHFTPVPGSEGAAQPLFSPDGQWLAFVDFEDFSYKKVPLAGGAPITLASFSGPPFGATWSPDGFIIVATESGPLRRFPDAGGQAESITTLDEEASEVSHRLPHVVPGTPLVFFTAIRHTEVGNDWSKARLWVKNLDTGERKLIFGDAADGRYTSTGHLVFARGATLMAAPFDLGRLEITGAPVPVVEGVQRRINGDGSNTNTGVAHYSISETGSLVYVPGEVYRSRPGPLASVDSQGTDVLDSFEPASFLQLRFSPDGSRVLVWERDPHDIWLLDLERGTRSRQTFQGMNHSPAWMPDGKGFLFLSLRNDEYGVFLKTVDSADKPRKINSSDAYPAAVAPDGKEYLAVTWDGQSTGLARFPVDGDGDPQSIVDSPAHEVHPDLSHDGRWLAYASNETGQNEVYVLPYPGPGPRVQISTDRGSAPTWSWDGREIIYLRRPEGNQTQAWSTPITIQGDQLVPGTPEYLFSFNYGGTAPLRFHDLAPDGSILTEIRPTREERERFRLDFYATRVHLVQNWFNEVRQIGEE